MALLERFMEFAEDQPRLVRSALYGAAILFAMTVLRVLVLAPAGGPRTFLPALAALLLATTGGALGGLFYGLLRPLAGFGAVGRWLRWTLGIAVYAVGVVGIMAPFDRDARSMLQDPLMWIIGPILCLVYGTIATWMWRDMPDLPHEPKVGADTWVRDAVAADLSELRERGNQDPDLMRIDLIEQRAPSRAYVMHLWRVVGRLGRIPAPSRQARIALRRAQRMLGDAERDFERSRPFEQASGARGA